MNNFYFYILTGKVYAFNNFYSCIASETNEFNKLMEFNSIMFISFFYKGRIEINFASQEPILSNYPVSFCKYLQIEAVLKLRKINVYEFIEGYKKAIQNDFLYKDTLFQFLKPCFLKESEENE